MASSHGMTVSLYLDPSGLRRGISQASRDLRKFDRDGTRAVRGVDRATHTLGNTFKNAARYAVGAAAAYISIDQARIAVETTLELNKATGSLVSNFGMATKSASAWAATARARGVDSQRLSMGFKTLATQIEQAKSGSESSIKTFGGLGISMRDLKNMNFDQTLAAVANGLEGAGAGSERVALAGKLLGRTWAPLLPVLRGGADELKRQKQFAIEVGAAYGEDTKSGLDAMRDAFIKAKIAQMGLQIQFTTALAPALTFVATKFTDLARIMNNPELTGEQKFNKIGKMIEKSFQSIDWNRVGEVLAKGIEGAMMVLTEISVKIIPPLTDGLAKAAPRIMFAMAKAIVRSTPTMAKAFFQAVAQPGNNVSKAIANSLVGKMRGAAKGMKTALGSVAGFMKDRFSDAVSAVIGRFSAFKDRAASAIRAVRNAIQAVIDKLKSINPGGLASTIANGIRNALNAALPNQIKLGPIRVAVPQLARGGKVPGVGTGDKIPALLEPGEFVMNRRAVAAYGVDTMMKMNSSVPRMKLGGILNATDIRGLETTLAVAELTPGLDDDITAASDLASKYKASAGAILNLSNNKKKWRKLSKKQKREYLDQRLSDLQSQKSYEDMVASLKEEQSGGSADSGSSDGDSGSSDLIEQQNVLLQQQIQNQQALLNVSQSQYGVLAQALAAAVSGHIGGKVGLGLQTPSVAGRLASY